MTDEERQMFRKAAIEYLRDPDTMIDTKVQAKIADEIEWLAKELEGYKIRCDNLRRIAIPEYSGSFFARSRSNNTEEVIDALNKEISLLKGRTT